MLMLHNVYCKAHISTKEVSYVDLFNQVLNFQFNYHFNCKICVFVFPYSSDLVCEWPLSLCSLCMFDVEWSSWIYFSVSFLYYFSVHFSLYYILRSFVDLDNFWVSIMIKLFSESIKLIRDTYLHSISYWPLGQIF